jgi:hypothetical protein
MCKNNLFLDINNINFNFDNPKYIYVYHDCYEIFKDKLQFSNNSDNSVDDIIECNYIANHPKIEMIPIGFANEH